jgi:murein DD-endopeptidase MepM/ murein hydrolase activator NlpD
VPFAISTNYRVTQAFPEVITHQAPDSFHAVDIAMPIGTNVFAARAGIVFDVASENYAGGTDREEHGQLANVVQILHDDGTFAIYAHLNWNSIRVRPGQRVARGQYIADSGNTGFSSGPHLHFAVLRNRGLELESVPVRFEGADSDGVVPATGAILTAY